MSDMTQNYSVLMSVYYKEKPQYLREAIESMLSQSVRTNDFVLVCDGPLTKELDAVIEKFDAENAGLFNIIRLEKNGGLGAALALGIVQCKNELVARMDSDDISKPTRCERELEMFSKQPDLSITGCNIEEFEGSTDNVLSVRRVPESYEDIVSFSKRRNPFNHMTVMFKKSDVLEAGSYQSFDRLEDYFLWIRMLAAGKKGCNIGESLLFARVDKNMYERRSGSDYVKSQKRLFSYMREHGYISAGQYIRAVIERSIVSLIPNTVRKAAFLKLAR